MITLEEIKYKFMKLIKKRLNIIQENFIIIKDKLFLSIGILFKKKHKYKSNYK